MISSTLRHLPRLASTRLPTVSVRRCIVTEAHPTTTAGPLPVAPPVAVVPPPQPPVFVSPVHAAPPRKPRGGFFRGGLLGFLVGISLAGSTAYVYLLDEYTQSSTALLASVEDLQRSTHKVRDYTQTIETVKKEQKEFAKRAATLADLEKLRNELLKAIDDVNLAHLEHVCKANEWEADQGKVKKAITAPKK
ncbi:hypothetical protein HKX48_001324 [Thoreauomyces humboldtii]|nr:hypothetical protein HKX48_001324 [Thoreauomyces humboldtii]